ncbi:MAG: ABC transporter permease [Candidatus Nanopelagicales bacterium]|nr:ABC transporter permease [Candidatus Nanopelagicales bacterium]MDP4824726.1 ABC transporter permease [Candidatus Nanopelagicales bacterium]
MREWGSGRRAGNLVGEVVVQLALTEMRRAKLRFGLLTGAVSLLVFLVLLLTTLSGALVGALTGALEGLRTDGLAYSQTARDNISASRLPADTVDAVAAVSGVSAAAGIATLTTGAAVAGESLDVQVFGVALDGPGAPSGLQNGRLPTTDGEAAVDGSVSLGDVITLDPSGVQLTVVGLLRGAQFNAIPTAYTTLGTYDAIVRASFDNLPFVPINAVAFTVADDASISDVVAAIERAVPGVSAYSLADAVALIPGIESISQSFGILVGLTFIIGIVVIGFFFLILTVQKLKAFTLLRAIGTSSGRLALSVSLQIAIVVLLASVIAVALTFLAVQSLNTGLPVNLNVATIITTVLAVLVFSLLSGLLSVRRIVRLDPATAVGAR